MSSEGAALSRVGQIDAVFSERLDVWGAYFRVLLVCPGIAIALWMLPDQRWVAAMCVGYLAIAALVPAMLRSRSLAPKMRHVRPVLVLLDVAVVSSLTYAFGTEVSSSSFMYVPIVVGWTLVPQRGMGALSLVAVLTSVLTLLILEALHIIVRAPSVAIAPRAPGGPVLFFTLLAVALTAVHLLVGFVVARLGRHVLAVGRLRAEKEAREREAAWALELEETQRLEALGRLAGGVAHDFNNLLTALLGFSEIAQRTLHSDPPVAESALRELNAASERAANLTTQLLDFASRRSTQPRPLELRCEIEKCAQLLARVLRADIELAIELCDEPCVCNIDPSGLERVLVNLAVNARDAMPSGGKLSITLARAQRIDRPTVLLSVSDTGRGIEESDLPRIFEPFFTTKGRGRGAGLGLASVYGIVKQSGGEIDVLSTPGVGTMFLITLPLAAEDATRDARTVGPVTGEGTVLLVDDDHKVRAVARAHLEAAGYKVLEASRGEDALVIAREHAIQLLVSDVAMPGMSGLELTRSLRERYPELPILLISGYSDASIGQHERLPSRVRFLSKPFTAEKLTTEVSHALGRSA